MEYNPRYPQPFTLTQAIALDPEVAWDGLILDFNISQSSLMLLTEIARLRNSLLHLRRSQTELQEYLQELAAEEVDLEVSQAVKENEITMHVSFGLTILPALKAFRASQDERIFMLKLALTHHGHSVASEQASSSPSPSPGSRTERPQNTTASNSNGLDDVPSTDRASEVSPETPQVEEQQNGVYL
ncbi:hypothetical protein V8E55_001968 [Tylopilus felleus]